VGTSLLLLHGPGPLLRGSNMGLPIIVLNSRVPKLMSFVIDVYAITLWPFVFIRDDGNEITIRHETIHIKQYNELFVLGFLAVYLCDWLRGLIKYKDKQKAYYQIRFEQEAYTNQKDPSYLAGRKHYAWRNYSV